VTQSSQIQVNLDSLVRITESRFVARREFVVDTTIVPFQQVVNGVPFEHKRLRVVFDNQQRLIGVMGDFESSISALPNPIRVQPVSAATIFSDTLAETDDVIVSERIKNNRLVLREFRQNGEPVTRVVYRINTDTHLAYIDAETAKTINFTSIVATNFVDVSGRAVVDEPDNSGNISVDEILMLDLSDELMGNQDRRVQGEPFGAELFVEAQSDKPVAQYDPITLNFNNDIDDKPETSEITSYFNAQKAFLAWINYGINPPERVEILSHIPPSGLAGFLLACNAFAAGSNIGLVRSVSGICSDDTFVFPDIINHELGHVLLNSRGFMSDSVLRGSFHEGFADLHASLFDSTSPGLVAEGFRLDGSPIRDLGSPELSDAFTEGGSAGLDFSALPSCDGSSCTVSFEPPERCTIDNPDNCTSVHTYGLPFAAGLFSAISRVKAKAFFIAENEGVQLAEDFSSLMIFLLAASPPNAGLNGGFGTYSDLLPLIAMTVTSSDTIGDFVFDVLYELAVRGIAGDFTANGFVPVLTRQPIVSTLVPYRMFDGSAPMRVFSGLNSQGRLLLARDKLTLDVLTVRAGLNDNNACEVDGGVDGPCFDTGWEDLSEQLRVPFDPASNRSREELIYHAGVITIPSVAANAFESTEARPVFVRALGRNPDGTGFTSSELDFGTMNDYRIFYTPVNGGGGNGAENCDLDTADSIATILFLPLTIFLDQCDRAALSEVTTFGTEGACGTGCMIGIHGHVDTRRAIPLTAIWLVLMIGGWRFFRRENE